MRPTLILRVWASCGAGLPVPLICLRGRSHLHVEGEVPHRPRARGFSILAADASHFWPGSLSHRFTSASKAVLFKELGLETREMGRESAARSFIAVAAMHFRSTHLLDLV
jgi:hypothetical protein